MVEAASPDEDPGEIQDELRRVGLRPAGARHTQPAQRVGRLGSHVKIRWPPKSSQSEACVVKELQ